MTIKTEKQIDAEVAAAAEQELKGPEPTDLTPRQKAARTREANKRAKKEAAASKAKTGRPPADVATTDKRARRVKAMYEQIGGALVLAGLGIGNANIMAGGEAMAEHADELGKAWADAANSSPKIAALIDKMTTGGALGALVLAHMPIARAIMDGPSEDSAAGMMGDIMGMVANMTTEA